MESCLGNCVRRSSPNKWAVNTKESVKNTQKKYDSFRRVLAENTDEFCKNTTLHGLKYVRNRSLHPAERFVWGYMNHTFFFNCNSTEMDDHDCIRMILSKF